VNSGYVLWFGALVIVAGAALLWLAIGSVPEIPAEPEAHADPGQAGEPDATIAPGRASDPDWAITWAPLSESGPGSEPRPGSEPGPGSEPAGEDRFARPG
jgi:hypothetical protein